VNFDYKAMEALRDFLNYSKLARAHGISVRTIRNRIAAGLPFDQVFMARPTMYGAFSRLARLHGMTPQILRWRLKSGMSLDDALSTPIRVYRPRAKPGVDKDSSDSDRGPAGVARAKSDENRDFHSDDEAA
jgi:hypothetical protein